MILKQTIGIDVSMDNFEVRFGTIDTTQDEQISMSEKFTNNEAGFKKFMKWAMKKKVFTGTKEQADILPLFFVMEVTGVYHEKLAHFLYKNGQQVITSN
ncbi:MAG: transposase [bacterium]